MKSFYGDVLGLTVEGRDHVDRPGLSFGCGGVTLLHIVEADGIDRVERPQIEHFAFAAVGLGAFMARLDRAGMAYNLSNSPGEGLVRVNLRDPDDNRLHVDFPIQEFEPGMVPKKVSLR
jgi:catechol 2,3-dioxygenase-like lactoylglutathione lyase family enzyme